MNPKNSNPKFTGERHIFHYTFLFDAYDGDKEWLVLKTEDGSTQMVSAKLVSRTKPQPQQSTNTNNSGGNGSTTPQPPASNGGSSGGQPSGGSDPGSAPIGGGMFSGLPESGGPGNYGPEYELNWE